MIGHQTEAEQPQRQPRTGLAEQTHEGMVIALVVEDFGALITPVEGMVTIVANRGSGRTRMGSF